MGLEVVEGIKIDRGYISPYFITDNKTQLVEFEDPLILLYDKKISSVQSILPLLEQVAKVQKPLLLMAEDVDGEALAMLIVNKLRGGLKVAAVKAPGFDDNRKAMLQDLAVITGAEMVSEEMGGKLEDLTLESLGTAKRVSISKDESVILDGYGEKSLIEERCEQIRSAIEGSSSEYEKDKLKERLAKISGGVAVIKVGGASEVEVGEIKDRLNDALNATKAAGEEGAVVVAEILKSEDKNYGFNAATGEYVDLIKTGIIDPTKVVRTALADAASVATLMTTTEAIIAEEVEADA